MGLTWVWRIASSHEGRIARGHMTAAAIGTALLGTIATGARAEPVVDRALGEVQVQEEKSCSRLRIEFNFRVRYAGHVPTGEGRSITIQVRPVDRAAASAMVLLKREALRPVATRSAGVRDIVFDAGGGLNPSIRLEFDRAVALDAAQGADFSSVIVSLAPSGAKKACLPVFPSSAWSASVITAPAAPAAVLSGQGVVARGSGVATKAQQQKAEAAMDEARAAIKKQRYGAAIDKLRNVLVGPETASSREAQELLGTAYQRSGDVASARAQYEDYLARYPEGEDAARVRQRLRGVLTALGEPPPKLRDAESRKDGTDGQSSWSVAGSFSQFYLRNDGFRTLRDPSLPPQANPDPDEHRVHQNSLLTGLDVTAAWNNAFAKSKLRFSGTEEHDFSGEDPEIVGVASLYFETAIRDYDLNMKIGRQTESANGVLGRFDGASIVWRANDLVRFGVIGGSPVWRRRDAPFEDGKYFYGANVGVTPLKGLDIGLYALEQRVDDLVDRRAIGTDIRYLSPSLSVFATLDYDVHFGEVNLALLNASWTLPSKTVVYGAIDHRKSPFLTTSAALQGQPFLTLYDMLKLHTEEELYQFASDRAATFNSASLGVSHPLNAHWQVTLDANWTNVSETPDSGGVAGQKGTGDEFYYSAQLIGTNLTTEGDTLIAALRYADRQLSDLYVLDTMVRYPVTDKLRLSPRLRLGLLEGKGLDLTEYTVQPSLLVDYKITDNWHFETEVGATWSERHTGSVEEQSTDLFITAGYRFDFYADGKTPCALPGLMCQSRLQ